MAAEGAKGWRAWDVTAGHRLETPGQTLRKVEGREVVRGDPVTQAENVLEDTAEAKQGRGGADVQTKGSPGSGSFTKTTPRQIDPGCY